MTDRNFIFSFGFSFGRLLVALWMMKKYLRIVKFVALGVFLVALVFLHRFHFCTLYYEYCENSYKQVIGRTSIYEYDNKFWRRTWQIADVCATFSPQSILVVKSATHHFDLRQNIRHVWAKDYTVVQGKSTELVLIFSIGVPRNRTVARMLKEENEIYRDLLFIDVEDTYDLLSYRHYGFLHWVNSTCPVETKFLVSVDDDVVMHIPSLAYFMENNFTEPVAIYGHIWRNAPVSRDWNSKHYYSRWQWYSNNFPDFASGGCHVITRLAIPKLLNVARTIPPMREEDVYFLGIVAERAGVPRIQTGFKVFWGNRTTIIGCNDDQPPPLFAFYNGTTEGYRERSDVEAIYQLFEGANCTFQ